MSTQWRVMPEDGISPLPSLSLEYSEKKEAEGASVVVRFWPSSRSRYVSEHLEASLLFEWAHLIYNPNMGLRQKPCAHGPKKKASGLAPSPHLIRHHYPDSLLNRSCAALLDANNKYKDHFLLVQGPFPEPPKAPTGKPSGACYSCTTYNWIAWSSWFTDPATLLDHPTF